MKSRAPGVVAAILDRLALLLSRDDIFIRHRPGAGTTIRGRVPQGKLGAIREFFARDLPAHCVVTVRGRYSAGRALRLEVSGPLGPGERQQVRNFLHALLR